MELYPWLRNLPPHWQIARLGHIAKISTGTADVQDSFDDGEYPFFIRSPKVKRLPYFTHDTEAVLTAGDGNVGDIFHHYKGKFVAHQRVYIVEPGPLLYGRYLYYVMMQSFKDSLSGNTAKSTVESLRRPMLTSFQLPLPPFEEQKRIADDIDRELAEIDELIADVQRLESLEQERMAAERDWTFEQSETSVPLRYIAKFITSGSRGWGDYVGSAGSPFMRITNLRRDSVEPDLSDLLYVDTNRLPNDEGKRSQLQIGDILISITAELGSVAVVDERIAGGYVSQHLALVRIDTEKYDPYQIAEAILSSNVKNQINQKSYGGTKVQLSLEDIKELCIPIKNEQVSPKPYQSKKGIIELLTEKKFSTLHKNILGTVNKGLSQ